MQLFSVTVTRQAVEAITVQVEAEDEYEAESAAISQANDNCGDWEILSSDEGSAIASRIESLGDADEEEGDEA